jgi:hypothetical protein
MATTIAIAKPAIDRRPAQVSWGERLRSANKQQADAVEAIKQDRIDGRIAKVAFQGLSADRFPSIVYDAAEGRPRTVLGGRFGEKVDKADNREATDQQRNPNQQTDHDGADEDAQHRPCAQSVAGGQIRAVGAQEGEIPWPPGFCCDRRLVGVGRCRRRGRAVGFVLRRTGRPIGKVVRTQAERDRFRIGVILTRLPRPPPLQRGREVAAAGYAGHIVKPLEQIILGQGLQNPEGKRSRSNASAGQPNSAPRQGLSLGTEPLRSAGGDVLLLGIQDLFLLALGAPDIVFVGGSLRGRDLRRLSFCHETLSGIHVDRGEERNGLENGR